MRKSNTKSNQNVHMALKRKLNHLLEKSKTYLQITTERKLLNLKENYTKAIKARKQISMKIFDKNKVQTFRRSI